MFAINAQIGCRTRSRMQGLAVVQNLDWRVYDADGKLINRRLS
jgi:hypothetical protein